MKLRQYDYFGERALLNDAPRAATVTAVTGMKLLCISKALFEEVLGPLERFESLRVCHATTRGSTSWLLPSSSRARS